jgi:hypothetical protein
MMYKKFTVALCIFSLVSVSFMPNISEAYFIPNLPTVPTDTVPPVPTSDSAIRNKEVGITIFGYTIPGVSWNSIAIGIAKKTIEKIVDSTTDWINSGFEGSPTYVTNPETYFTNIADQIAGDFIEGSNLGFLCSPFQAQIRLSLVNNYYKKPQTQYQCTWTGIKGNLENFYTDFSAGGWDGWFQMTQNPVNNPYDAYLTAKVDLDERVAKAVGLKKDEFNINSGFLSTRDCLQRNGRPSTQTISVGGVNMPAPSTYNPSYPPGGCIQPGPIKTPGKVIESQLEKTLGTGLTQLELADSFDELINALLGQLLTKSVFAAKGIFTSSPEKISGGNGTVGGGTTESAPQVTCAARSQNATVGEDRITWGLQSALEFGATYVWSGTEMPNPAASTTSVTIVYQTPGTKTASVTATPLATPENPNPRPITVSCQNTVLVSQYRPLTVSCAPEQYTTTGGAMVNWDIFVSGGSGNIRDVSFDGSENFIPKTHTSVWPNFDPNANLVVSPYNTKLQTIKSASSTKLILTRGYFDGDGPRDLSVTVVDQDTTVQAVVNKRCDGSIYVSG